ncbi:ArnT family glycosyltransferase [Maritalea porphyrae]|uniref:ArnT family glycosyltransferase n=1 Tax=Maritalea porphyrae TaxID=880732 RepID=UPI0022AF3506|nr:glycosyltransferase family 39 protein [Maritalea porphyrae]MCZ4271445.1 glycosyltransferase family 39 protein [Maritalea porphyrae]
MQTGAQELRHRIRAPQGQIRNAVIWLIVATTIYRLWGAWAIDLVIGEAYYLSSARQLHLSYFDQPPVFLWVIWLTKTLTGSEAPIILRLPFVLMFSGATWMFYRIGARFHSERAGLFTAIIANIPILFTLSIGSWMQPEAPLTLLWLVAVWLLMDIFFGPYKRSPIKSWLLVGLVLGLTFMTKYHAVFLVYGAGLFALFNKDARKWILHPGPYLAFVVAAIISLPVLIWNLQNDMASFAFQGGRALGDQFRPEWLLRMIGGQLIYMTPWIALPALWVGAKSLFKGPTAVYPLETQSGMSFFFVMLAHGPILFFTAVAAWSDTQFHFHWQAPGYMMLFPILGASSAILWDKHRKLVLGWLVVGAVLSFVVMTALISHTVTGWARDYFPPGEDPTNGALRWQELEDFFDAEGVFEKENTFTAGYFWTECGMIDNVVRGKLPLACLSDDPRNIAFNIYLTEHQGDDAYVAAVLHDDATVMDDLSKVFESVERVGEVVLMRNGAPAMNPIRIYKGRSLRVDREFKKLEADNVEFAMLPRTQIVELKGNLSRTANDGSETVNLLLDGKNIGQVEMNGPEAEFVIYPPHNWQIGMRDVLLEFKAESGAPIKIDYLTVDVANLHL